MDNLRQGCGVSHGPAGQGIVRDRRCQIHSARDGAGKTGGGGVSQQQGIGQRVGQGLCPGRGGKDQIAVHRAYGWARWRGPCRHGRRWPCAGPGPGSGRHRWRRWRWWCCGGRRAWSTIWPGSHIAAGPWPPNSPSISNGAAQKCLPSPTVVAPRALTATSAPTVCPEGRTSEAEPRPPLSVAVVAPVPAPAVPRSKAVAGERQGLLAKGLVGVVGPVLVAAVQQVEQDRGGDDWDALVANLKAPTLPAQRVSDTRGGVEAKRRSRPTGPAHRPVAPVCQGRAGRFLASRAHRP